MVKRIKLIILKFIIFFSLYNNVFYIPNINSELSCFVYVILNTTISKSKKFYIFKNEWEKNKNDWNKIKQLILKKFFHYYQIWYNFKNEGPISDILKRIKIEKFLINGFKIIKNDERDEELKIFFNYKNSSVRDADKDITFLILPENSEYYSNMLENKIASGIANLQEITFDKKNKNLWRFIQLYWNSVIQSKIHTVLFQNNSQLKLINLTFDLIERFFIFSGYENTKPNHITFLYRYYLFNNNYHRLDILLK